VFASLKLVSLACRSYFQQDPLLRDLSDDLLSFIMYRHHAPKLLGEETAAVAFEASDSVEQIEEEEEAPVKRSRPEVIAEEDAEEMEAFAD